MAIQTYENFVLENKMTDLVNTNLDVNALFTTDNSLEQAAGLKKVVNKYTYSGAVEKLAKGAKNSTKGSVTFVPTEYEVERYQQTYEYNDMDVMQDPYVVDVASTGAATLMSNEIKAEYFDELAKISNEFAYTTLNYDAIVDGLASINREVESDQFIVMGIKARATIRKDNDYKASRQGEILYNGQFGTISGVPCVFSKLCEDDEVYITSKDQVKFFVKKAGSVEQDRNIETKDNTVVYERHGVMALVDETKSVRLAKAATTATTVTATKNATKVTGAATTGADVKVYVNGELVATGKASNSAYDISFTKALASGDNVKVVARKAGQVSSSAETTVA